MRVVVLVDWEACRSKPGRMFETLAGTEQDFVTGGLRAAGHEVVVLPFCEDIPASIARLRQARPDVVFNLTASLAMDRRNAHVVTALLDLMGLPYTGSDSSALMICLDKALSKLVVRGARVQTPDFITLEPGREEPDGALQFPLIVKPRFGGSSEFLSKRSIVTSREKLTRRVNDMFRFCGAPLICEEFVEGRDISVGVLGNEKLMVLPPREVRCCASSKQAPRFETHRLKHDAKYQAKWGVSYRQARLSDSQKKELGEISRRVYRALDLRDYARLDFRLTPNSVFKFLEANAHPDLSPSPHSSVGRMCSWAGIDYGSLLNGIMKMALKRARGAGGGAPGRAAAYSF